MSGPILFLDIGATLVDAAVKGPASRIAAGLGLDDRQRHALRRALMTTDFQAPEEVAAYATASFGAEREQALCVAGEIWSAQEGDASPLPGAAEALARLHAEGWRLGLISNIWRPYFVSVRRHYGTLFDSCIPPRLRLCSFELGMAKPDPAVFAEALIRADVPASEAVMVGDSYRDDIEPAVALGMETVWVLSRPPEEAEALARVDSGTSPRPSQIVPSLDALDPRRLSCAHD